MKKLLSKMNTRKLCLVLLDLMCAYIAVFLTLRVRFSLEMGSIPDIVLQKTETLMPYWFIVVPAVFLLLHMYDMMWKYVGIRDAMKVFLATFLSIAVMAVVARAAGVYIRLSLYVMMWLIFTGLTLLTRFGYRFFRVCVTLLRERRRHGVTRLMVIGAGNAGYTIIHEIQREGYSRSLKVVCIIDDDPEKLHMSICGARVVGGRGRIIKAAADYRVDEIAIAIPSISEQDMKELFSICEKTSCVLKTLPGVYQLLCDEPQVSMLRNIDITDLLGRPNVNLDFGSIKNFVGGKTVLVTGAGGSVGSELCRQIAKAGPARILLFDICENGVFSTQNDLLRESPGVETRAVIGSVRDKERLGDVFSEYRPQIVFHAAAHKHVPLMEENPGEAVKNNIFGTLNVVRAADEYRAENFVLISTDKAVNPTNVMGATKRVCEMIVQSYAKTSATRFAAVRFGNVLDSNGSVVPTFRRQIELGGPVTVTHPESIRYFMTIPEAVYLVLQAGARASGGELFVLDMGAPVKILTLAENMIRLAGLVPYRDINIVFTGLRPGEKLREELLTNEEGLIKTDNSRIYIGRPADTDPGRLSRGLGALERAIYTGEDVRAVLADIVPSYDLGVAESDARSEKGPEIVCLGCTD